MANPYNQFGTTYAAVVALYPGTVVGDYVSSAVIDTALNRAVREIAASLNQESFRNLTEPDLELVERRATAGQTSLTLGANVVAAGSWPIVANKTHVWVGQPQAFSARPLMTTDPYAYSQQYGIGVVAGMYDMLGPMTELPADQFTVNVATGVVTLVAPMQVNDLAYASYVVDVMAAAYAVPSLAEIAVLGAGAELGARLYSAGNQEWKLVEDYRTRYTDWLKRMVEGAWIPDELRYMRWWQEVERVDEKAATSTRMYRG